MIENTHEKIVALIAQLSGFMTTSRVMVSIKMIGGTPKDYTGRLATVGTFKIGILEDESTKTITSIEVFGIAEMGCIGRTPGVPLELE